MALKIYNYSFYPATEYIKDLGIIELSNEVTDDLRKHLIFEYPPTSYVIGQRCKLIVDYAIDHDHRAVFLRNYETYQSFLIREFQKNHIQVFVPYYLSNEYTETMSGYDLLSHIAYLNIKDIIELPVSIRPLFTLSEINFNNNQGNYELYITGNIVSSIQVRFELVDGSINDIIKWYLNFVNGIKNQKIQDYLVSIFGFEFSNQDLLIEKLIDRLNIIKEDIHKSPDDSNIDSDKINRMIEIIQIVTIIDSDEVQEYLSLIDHAIKQGQRNTSKAITVMTKAKNLLKSIDPVKKQVIDRFNTNSFREFGINRYYTLKYNSANLYLSLGYYYLNLYQFIESKINLEKSVQLFQEYKINEMSPLEIDNSLLNLIYVYINLNQLDDAKSLLNDGLCNIEPDETQRIVSFKRFLSTIHRNMGEYDRALQINQDIRSIIDQEEGLEQYYFIEIRNAIIYYLQGSISKPLEMLEQIFNNHPLSIMIRSYAWYIYNLVLFMDNRPIMVDKQHEIYAIKDSNIMINSLLGVVEVLNLISKSTKRTGTIQRLNELLYLYPDKNLILSILIGSLYIKDENWTSLSELFDKIIISYSQHSSILRLRFYLAKYYLGIIRGVKDPMIENMIEVIREKDGINIPNYKQVDSKIKAIDQLERTLSMDLVKLDQSIYNLMTEPIPSNE